MLNHNPHEPMKQRPFEAALKGVQQEMNIDELPSIDDDTTEQSQPDQEEEVKRKPLQNGVKPEYLRQLVKANVGNKKLTATMLGVSEALVNDALKWEGVSKPHELHAQSIMQAKELQEQLQSSDVHVMIKISPRVFEKLKPWLESAKASWVILGSK